MTHELTHIDLFSGIGGFSLAARWAGFRTVCFSEVDPYTSAVLRKHWPGVPNLGDITRADFGPHAGATLLTGGFPCQPFSCAGKQRGKEDHRFLWPAMLEAIATVKPTWIVGENVSGIISMELDRVLADLEGQGYTAFPLIIPACAVDAKHRRDRVWIVAHSEKLRRHGGEHGKHQEEGGIQFQIRASGCPLSDTESKQAPREGSSRFFAQPSQCCGWEPEPPVGRVVDGLPNRLDRLKGLGNAIVPQVAFQILKAIADLETK